MLSKNNRKEQFRKQEPKKQRFAIKKLTVGVASVLIGFTFMGMNASADTTTEANSGAASQPIAEAQNSAASNQANNSQATLTTPTSQSAKSNDNQAASATPASETAAQKYENAVSDTVNQATEAAAKSGDASITTPASSSAASANSASEQKQTAAKDNGDAGISAQSLTPETDVQPTSTNNNDGSENFTTFNLNAATPMPASAVNESKAATQSQDASDWSSLINAVEDSNVGIINLTGNITVTGKTGNLTTTLNGGGNNLILSKSGIARNLTINGNGETIDFGKYSLKVGNETQNETNPNWNVTFKNLNIVANDSQSTNYSPLYLGQLALGAGNNAAVSADNQKNITVTLDGVNANISNRYGLISGHQDGNLSVNINNEYYHLILKGNNNIVSEGCTGNATPGDDGDALSAGYITVEDGTTTVTQNQTSSYNLQYGGATVRVAQPDVSNDDVVSQYSLDVKDGATLSLNGGKDVKGIVVANATTGTVNVDGKLNMNMGEGHSIAILAGNLNVGKTGDLDIQTKQVQTGGRNIMSFDGGQYGVLSIGVGYPQNLTNQDQNVITNNGTIKIVRTATDESLSPLISMGSGASGVLKGNFTVNVNPGATFDLQDSTQQKDLGMIYVSGSSVKSFINFNAPKYVNLQRLSALPVVNKASTSNLIYLEGQPNGVTITQSPVAQWTNNNMSSNPDYTWILNSANSMNNWGTNADTGFTAAGQSSPQNKAGNLQFMYSNGSVTLAPTQGGLNQYSYNGSQTVSASSPQGIIVQGTNGASYYTPYLNQFLNNFNYWRPQRLAMGSELLANPDVVNDATKYQPVVKTIDGNTKQTLADLNPKDGISGLLEQTGVDENGKPIYNTIDDLTPIKTVDWYNSSDEATWKKLMGDEAVPTNPTGDLKTTDKSAWAKVTYTDGSIDFANIPLNITEPMADLYTPSYKPVSVEQGQSATADPTFTDQDSKTVTTPTGTTFATGTDTPDWAKIDPSTGTVTVKPDTAVTPGAYNIPVTVTYPDKSTDETTVPVIVTKADQTVTWGDNGAIVTTVDSSKLNAHETTANSQVLNADSAVTAVSYAMKDGKLSTTATPITIAPSTVSWTAAPDTNVETATASGKEIENNSIKIDFTNNDVAKNILGSKNGAVTTNPFTITAKGAGAKNVTTPVNIQYQSDLTSDQFSQLVENNIPNKEIKSTTWATKPNAQGQDGVIKITFTDKDAQGNPTYLNVAIPASSIKVTTDADENTPTGQDVSTEQGIVPDAEKGIKNTGDMPDGTKYTWTDPDQVKQDVKTPGSHTETITVTYPDGSKEDVQTNVIVNAKPEIKPITTTVNGTPAATEGIANLNHGGTTSVDGYPSGATWTTKPDTSKPGATTGVAKVTYPDGTTQTVTIPVAVNSGQDQTIIDDQGHTFSLHANNVVTHKTSDKNIIGQPVIENFKLSYYEGGQNYSKPYIYTLNADKTAYVLTQTGDNPVGVTVNAPQSIDASEIKISWTAADTPLFNNGVGEIKGNGQPSSLVSDHDGNTGTQIYTGSQNDQYGYPMYSAAVDSSSVNWPIYGNGPKSTHPFPSVYIYGAEANGTIPSVNSDTTDLKKDLGDASKLVNTSDLTSENNAQISSVEWQKLPSLEKADAKASATVRINFVDGSHLDIPVVVNVIKVDQGVDDKTNHDIYRDITRTINVEWQSTPVVQHVIYSRAKVTDLSKPADQQVTYTDWAAAKNSEGQVVTNFPQFNVTKSGYTATATGATIETVDGKQYVPASATITPDSQNEVVNVTYTANAHTLVINYVDGNGTVVGTYNVPGKTDETVSVDVPGHVPTNWKLVPNQQTINSYKFGSDDPQPVDYKVEHGTEVVPVDENNKDTYRKVTQTIREVPAGKTDADMVVVRNASFEFKRTGVKDLVTNKITWNAWNSDSQVFPAYDVKQEKGYDSYVNGAKATQVAAVTVNPDSANITDTITYAKENATPVPYDPSNKDMNMSVTRTINYEVPAGHDAIAPVTQTIEYVRDNNGVAGYQDPVTGEIAWNPWQVKSGKAEFPSAAVEQIKGYDSYVDGTKATEVASASVVEKDGTPQNGTAVTVTYKKSGSETPTEENFKQSIVYQDKDGNVISTANDAITGTFTSETPATVTADELKTKINANVPANWKVATSYIYPATETVQTKNPANIVVLVEHATKDVTPNDPSVNPTDPKYKDMFTTVSRDIYQTKPGKAETKIDTQYVDFGRNGVEDLVTGIVTGTGDWKVGKIENNKFVEGGKAEFASEDAPQIKGYDSYVDGIKSTEVPVASALKDGQPVNGAAVHITYEKENSTPVPYKPGKDGVNDEMNKYVTRTITVINPETNAHQVITQTVHFTNEDKDGNSGYQDPVTGKVTYNTTWHVAGNLNETNGTWDAYTAPEIKGYTPNPATVAQQTVSANTPNASVTIQYHADTDTPVKWDGTNDNMYREITRTIIVNIPNGDIQTQKQTVEFTREDKDGNAGYINAKTGETIWNAWHVVNSDQSTGTWNVYTAPKVDGYTADPATVNAEEVTPETKNTTVTVNYHKNSTDADKYTPEGQDVNTKPGVVPDPAEGIKNKSDLPDGTKYTWKTTPDVSTEGNKPAIVVVTYPDGSKDEVPVVIHVTNPTTPTDADKYTPEGQDVNTKTGVVPDPADGIKNKGDLPDGTKYTWKDTPDVSTEGNKPATVVVTYPDGSKDEVPVTIHVTNPTTDADKYTPEGQDVNTKTGVVPNPADGIKNKSDLPDGTKYTWKTTPDVSTAGDKPATVVVTYPDGSKDEVPVTIHVTNPTTPTDADKYTPEGQDVNTKPGVVPEPAEGIKNKSDLPDGTKYTWKDTPDVTKPGKTTGVIVVTYPDGSKDEVPVTIHVTNPTTDADKYTPEGQDVNTKPGVVPNPADGIKNKSDLPDGTKYTWEKTPDVTKPGESTGVIVVTYPDGSKDKVTVKVIVNTNNVTPETQPIHTTPGVLPNPADGIKNKDEMPAGTKYTWKVVPNVDTIGEHTGVITVTYPDGTSVDVTVKVFVDAGTKETDNKTNIPSQTISTKHPVSINTTTSTPTASKQQTANTEKKATLPQTGAKSESAVGLLGLAIAAVGSLFGLGAGKKRRDK